MESKDISATEKGFYKLEDQEKPWNTSSDELKQIGQEKLDALRNSIAEIKKLISERESLSKAVFLDAEKVKIEINNFLAETNAAGPEGNRDKVTLKQKQIEISELQLKEKISCWQDTSKLKEELREKEKELAEKKGRIDMLDKIMEE